MSTIATILLLAVFFFTSSGCINLKNIILSGTQSEEAIPINHFSEQVGNTWNVYAYPKYYKNEQGEYDLVDVSIRSSDKPGYTWEVTSGVYRLWIKENGTFTFEHWGDERSFEIDGIVVRNNVTGWEELIFEFDFSGLTPTVNGDTVSWTDSDGISYSVKYINDQLVDRVYIPKTLKDTIFSNLPSDQIEDLAVGIRYSYSVEASNAILDTSWGNIVFYSPDTGRPIHWITPAPLRFGSPESDDNGLSTILKTDSAYLDSATNGMALCSFGTERMTQSKPYYNTVSSTKRYPIGNTIQPSTGFYGSKIDLFSGTSSSDATVIRDKELTETKFYDMVPATAFNLGNSGLLFNDTVTFGNRGGENYSGVQDTSLLSLVFENYNFGTDDTLRCGSFIWSSWQYHNRLLFQFDLAAFDQAHPDATITGASLNLYVVSGGGGVSHTMSIYPVLDDWGTASGDWDVNEGTRAHYQAFSGEVCWNYERYNTSAWTTAGAGKSTSGVDGDASSDYDGTNDRGNTALASVTSIPVVGGNHTWTFGDQLARDVLQYQNDNAGHRYGFIMITDQEGIGYTAINFGSTENGYTYRRPQFSITFETIPERIDTSTISFTPANEAPTVDAPLIWTTTGTIASTNSMIPQVQYNAKVPVTDNNSLDDLSDVELTLFYDSDGSYAAEDVPGSGNTQTAAILTWTNGGSPTWSIDPSSSTTWSVVSGSCSAPSLTGTTGNFEFHFKPGKVATENAGSAKWHAFAEADDGITTASNYSANRDMNWYGETASITDTSFGTVSLGTSGSPSTAFSVTYISNGAYVEQVKSDANWVGQTSSGTISLYASGTNPGNAQFALQADDDDTLADAVQVLSASYTTIDDTGTQTTESGDAQANNNLWLWLGSADIPDEEYQGSVYLKIADGS
ncbi:MAG: hypothetical protein HQ553_02530 [Chloroflexi bacterium]|nr:hypothetical protein [Chloroflexota bacterium]